MINIEKETILSLREACRVDFVRQRGKPLAYSTIWRWTRSGSKSYDGTRVCLETVRFPAGVRTSREALARFIACLSGKDVDAPRTSPASRKWRTAEDELKRAQW